MPDQTLNQGVPGLGTVLNYGLHSTGSWTAVGQVKSVGTLALEASMQESTGLSSTWEEALPTLLKGGELPIGLIWNGAIASHAALLAAMLNKTLYYYQVVFPNPVGASSGGVTALFPAYVAGFAPGPEEAEPLIDAEVKLKITGAVTIS